MVRGIERSILEHIAAQAPGGSANPELPYRLGCVASPYQYTNARARFSTTGVRGIRYPGGQELQWVRSPGRPAD